LGPIGSAVLTFIGYKQADRQTDRQVKFIYRFTAARAKQEKLYFNIFFYSSGLYFIDALFNMNDFRIYMKDIQSQISNLEKCNWRDVLGFGIIT